MMTSRKYNLIRSKSRTARYPRSYEAVIQAIPPKVLATLTSADAAALVDAIWASWQRTKELHYAELVADGFGFKDEPGFVPEYAS